MNTPNILHISWHDAGRHFGCYGVETVHTPNIDRLAAEGTRFTRAFSCAAVCSPSRGACLTGRYPQSNGLLHLCHGNFGYRYNEGEKHLSQLLHERGYYTALHGFQHEVHPHHIREELWHFDECVNIAPAPPIYPIPPCEVVAEGAIEFLQQRKNTEQPFYLQLGFFETHRPYDFGGCEPDDSLGVTIPPYLEPDDFAREDHAALQGAIRKADAQVGRVLDALRESGLEGDTLVIFTPDHGLANPRAKASLYDPGLEIAFILRWPNGPVPQGRSEDCLISNVDLVPTLYGLCEWPTPGNFDGLSFADVLREGKPGPREQVFAMHHEGDLRGVRDERYKLIRNFSNLRNYKAPVKMSGGAHGILQKTVGVGAVAPVELYDLEEDPVETVNLAEEPAAAEVRNRLENALWRWMESVDDPLLRGAITPPRHHAHLREYQAWKA